MSTHKQEKIIEPSHNAAMDSYPKHYETTTMTKGGLTIFIRPIKLEDAPLLMELFNILSERSIYYRFFSPLKSLTPDMLANFTRIDYERDVALVAIDRSHGKEKMLGVARIMTKPGETDPEFAIAVGDPLQGKGIGAALMEHMLLIVKERDAEIVWGYILQENKHMLALARQFGFSISWDSEGHYYVVKADLKTAVSKSMKS